MGHMGGLLYIWYNKEGIEWGRSPPTPLLAVPNGTAHINGQCNHTPYCCIMVRCSVVLMCALKGYAEIKLRPRGA